MKLKACQLLHTHTYTHTHTHTHTRFGRARGGCVHVPETWVQSWVGRSPGGGHGNPLQYSCLEYSMHKGAWWGHKEPDMAQRLTLYFRPTELRPHLQRCQSPVASFTPKSLQTFRSYNAIGLWLLKLSWFSHLFAFALNTPSFWIFFLLLCQTHFKTQLRPTSSWKLSRAFILLGWVRDFLLHMVPCYPEMLIYTHLFTCPSPFIQTFSLDGRGQFFVIFVFPTAKHNFWPRKVTP